MDRTMLRKTFGFILTAAACFSIGRYVGIRGAWGHDAFDEIGGVEFFGILVFFVAAVVVAIAFRHHLWAPFLSIGLGVVAALWANDVVDGISWTGIGMIAGTIVALLLLWSLTVGKARPFQFLRRCFNRMRFGRRPQPSAPTGSPTGSTSSTANGTAPSTGSSSNDDGIDDAEVVGEADSSDPDRVAWASSNN